MTWEHLIDDEIAKQLAKKAWKADLQVLVVKVEIKKFPTNEKITKGAELKKLQDKARTLHDQEIMHNKETTEKQAEDERVTGIIHPIQQ